MKNSATYSKATSVTPKRLRASIVCYDSDIYLLKETLSTLYQACKKPLESGRLQRVEILLVNNGPSVFERQKIGSILESIRSLAPAGLRSICVGNGRNLGFGSGHNLTFDQTQSEMHLILNPDVEIASTALSTALAFFDQHPECGLIAPSVEDKSGNRQYLCKRNPSILDLLLRGFAPKFLRPAFQKRLFHYEMRETIGDSIVWDPPIVSGCFILVRTSILAELCGFNPKYFLYFEDFDLSLRAAKITRIAYVPSVRIIHHGGHAARKGKKHIFLFLRSAITFFSIHGWKWY